LVTGATASKKAEPAPPIGLLAELTHRCPLQCPYCSNPVELERANAELPTEIWLDVFHQAADLGVLHLHLSGGEPAARRDLIQLVTGAAEAGLYTNLVTSAVLLTREMVHALAGAGLDHVQISLQDVDAASADRLSGYRGGVKKKLDAATWVVDAGLPLTINAPVHRHNLARLPQMIQWALDARAGRLEVAHVQYYGWALRNRARLMPTRDQVMQSLEIVARERDRLKSVLEIDFVAPDYYADWPKPCMDGWGRSFLTVTPSGVVLPCHAAQTIPGLIFDTVTETPLREIWFQAPAFEKFRGMDWMREPCRSCSRRDIDFGGCRCQALALAGDAAEADPACAKSSRHAMLLALAADEAETADQPFAFRRVGAIGARS
jgi:pyrroloquinoline quinone biosynthesis protein E